MPPKRKMAAKPKKAAAKKGGKTVESNSAEKLNLRKNPKKKQIKDIGEDEQPIKQKTKQPAKAKQSAKTADLNNSESEISDRDDVVLATRESEDEFHTESDSSVNENRSSNAVSGETQDLEMASGSQSDPEKDKTEADRIDRHVDAALDKYFRKLKRKKKGKKKRRKRERKDSSSNSSSEYSSSSEDSDSDSSADRRRDKKRKRKERRKKEKRDRRGEKEAYVDPVGIASTSTVYTRGCKSPQNAIISDSSNGTLDDGGLVSNADTDGYY